MGILLFSLLVITSLSTVQAQLKTPTTTKIASPQLLFEKAPKTISLTSSTEDSGGTQPVPLTAYERKDAIRRCRIASGMSTAAINAAPPSPPVNVVLTPDVPVRSGCHFSMYYGIFRPWDDHMHATIIHRFGGFFRLIFWTQPGKSYFLDISANPVGRDHTWVLEGGINGSLTDTNGHLITGFTADSNYVTIDFYNRSRNSVFYRAELTQIN